MIPDGQLLCCASDMLAGQIDAHPMHFWARGVLWMDAGIRLVQRNRIEAIVQEPSVVSPENADLIFVHVGKQGPVPTSDYCKELLTLMLTPFFLMFHVTCPFFLTTAMASKSTAWCLGKKIVKTGSKEKGYGDNPGAKSVCRVNEM